MDNANNSRSGRVSAVYRFAFGLKAARLTIPLSSISLRRKRIDCGIYIRKYMMLSNIALTLWIEVRRGATESFSSSSDCCQGSCKAYIFVQYRSKDESVKISQFLTSEISVVQALTADILTASDRSGSKHVMKMGRAS